MSARSWTRARSDVQGRIWRTGRAPDSASVSSLANCRAQAPSASRSGAAAPACQCPVLGPARRYRDLARRAAEAAASAAALPAAAGSSSNGSPRSVNSSRRIADRSSVESGRSADTPGPTACEMGMGLPRGAASGGWQLIATSCTRAHRHLSRGEPGSAARRDGRVEFARDESAMSILSIEIIGIYKKGCRFSLPADARCKIAGGASSSCRLAPSNPMP